MTNHEKIKAALEKAWFTNNPKTFDEAMDFAADEIMALLQNSIVIDKGDVPENLKSELQSITRPDNGKWGFTASHVVNDAAQLIQAQMGDE